METRTSISRPETLILMRPSCGKPLLGDVEPRHDFQTRDDGRVELVDLGRHRLHAEHAVHAEADGEAFFLRLDVHVAGHQLEGLDQQLVDEPDDRGRLGDLGQFAAVVGRLADDLDPFLDVPRDELVDRVAADPQVLFDPLQDVVAAGEDRVEPEARQGGQLVEGLEVERVVGGDADFSVVASDGENRVPEDGRRGKLAPAAPGRSRPSDRSTNLSPNASASALRASSSLTSPVSTRTQSIRRPADWPTAIPSCSRVTRPRWRKSSPMSTRGRLGGINQAGEKRARAANGPTRALASGEPHSAQIRSNRLLINRKSLPMHVAIAGRVSVSPDRQRASAEIQRCVTGYSIGHAILK